MKRANKRSYHGRRATASSLSPSASSNTGAANSAQAPSSTYPTPRRRSFIHAPPPAPPPSQPIPSLPIIDTTYADPTPEHTSISPTAVHSTTITNGHYYPDSSSDYRDQERHSPHSPPTFSPGIGHPAVSPGLAAVARQYNSTDSDCRFELGTRKRQSVKRASRAHPRPSATVSERAAAVVALSFVTLSLGRSYWTTYMLPSSY